MPLQWLGNAIGGLLGIGGNALGARTQRENVDKTIRANKELAEYQYSRDLEMWERQNAYNDPAAQMARLKAAGLNPNMVYGQGVRGATGQASEMPKYNAPRVEYNYDPVIDVPNVISQFQDFQIRQAQVDNLRAQNEVIKNTGHLRDIQGTLANQTLGQKADQIPVQLDIARSKRDLLQQTLPYQVQFAEGRNKQQAAQIRKILQDTEFTKLKTDWYVNALLGGYATKLLNTMGLGKIVPQRIRQSGRKEPTGKLRYNSPSSWDRLMNLGRGRFR